MSAASLHDIPLGSRCTITEIDHDFFAATTQRRLAELGLRPGSAIIPLQRTSGNGRLISLGSTHYALDKHSAQHIFVTV
ncbi:MAG: FeoA family protein [Corynebacterium sp.]|nr:FeoA family protein [Corynebacterium sp.]